MQFLNSVISGLSLGSVYAIIALGYTMVYGIAKMLNFAHGDVIMVGGYISFCAMQYWGFPPVLGILAAIAVCTLAGIEAVVICQGRPVPDDMKAAAEREGVAIVTTPMSQFETSVALAELASASHS